MSLYQSTFPHMKAVERGRMFAPEYETPLAEFDVTTIEWTHVCSARFGESRPCGWSDGGRKDSTKWTGDSYRYDIFESKEGGFRPRVALRWWNGAGEGWLVAVDETRGGTVSLLRMIAAMPDEARRWDACHFLWETAHKTELAAAGREAKRYSTAFVEGRLKKAKRRGRPEYTVSIEPKKAEEARA